MSTKKRTSRPPFRLRRFVARTLALLLLLVLVAGVGGFFGWRYIAENWNADRVVRRIVIPQLEEQLGQPIEVETVRTNYFNRVQLAGITLGKNPDLPSGALLRARQIDVNVNIPALVFKRSTPLQAISRVAITAPTLFVERDKQGHFNVSSLFRHTEISPTTQWTGKILINKGTLIYRDNKIRDPHSKSLFAIAENLDGQVQFRGWRTVLYDAKTPKVLLNRGTVLPGIALNGVASPRGEWLQNQINAPQIPAVLVTSYLFGNKQLAARRGTVAMRGQVDWSKERGFAFKGTARLHQVTALLSATSVSPRLTPLLLENAEGLLQFDPNTVTFEKLQLQAQHSPLTLRGFVAYGLPATAFDLTLTSRSVQVSRWGAWLRPALPQWQLAGATAQLDMRLSGTAKRLVTRGTLASSQWRLQEKSAGNFAAAQFSAGWSGWIVPGRTPRTSFLTNVKANNAALASTAGNARAGQVQGQVHLQKDEVFQVKGNLDSTGLFTKTSKNESLQSARAHLTFTHSKSTFLQVNAQNARLTSPAYGEIHSGRARVQAAIADQTIILQSELRQFALHSARYGNADGEALTLAAKSALPFSSQQFWAGQIDWYNANLSGLRLAAFSPQLATQFRAPGISSGAASFQGTLDHPQLAGQLRLSQLTLIQDQKAIPLRDLKSTFSYADRQLLIRDVRAQSPYGELRGEIAADLAQQRFVLLAQVPQARFEASELNPYLRAQHLQLNGIATGRLLVSANNRDKTEVHAKFDLQLPAPKVLFQQTHLQARAAHLRGQIDGNYYTSKNWQFTAQAVLSAPQGEVQQHQSRGKLGSFRLTAQGEVQSDARQIRPFLQGTLHSAAVKTQLESLQDAVAVADLDVLWQWQENALIVPRLRALYADGTVDGQFALAQNQALSGEFLGRDVQIERIAAWLKKARPDLLAASSATGTGFVKAALDGTVQNPTLALDARVEKGTVDWGEGNAMHHLPVDSLRFKTHLALGGDKSTFTLPLQQFTLWSEGARLQASGAVEYRTAERNFAYDAHLDIDGIQLASALQNWPLPRALRQWQNNSDTKGALNAALDISGAGDAPRLSGTLHLPLAQSYDTALREVWAQIDATFARGEPVVRLADMRGEIAGAPFSADLTLDSARQRWTANARITRISAAEVLDFTQEFAQRVPLERDDLHLSRLPFRGQIDAQLTAEGTVDFAVEKPDFGVANGTISISSPQLLWRGETLGVLNADLELQPDALRIREASLLARDAENPRSIVMSGLVPWNADSPRLNARLDVSNARLSFVTMMLEQTGQVWRRTDNSNVWRQLIRWKDDLPPGTEGNISLNTHLTGQRARPRLEVASFKLRDASARTPGLWGQGPVHALPDVDAAGVYADGTLYINQFQARLAATQKEHDDLLLHTIGTGRVTPGGTIDLNLELLHGQLEDLSLWMATLRNDDGSSALRGNLEQIALRVTGTTETPRVIGSIEANNIDYRGYSLDRLRVSRFDINDGRLFIRPGNFTVIKGEYQSSTGWGYLPWSWGGEDKPLGLVRNGIMEIHLPLRDPDFGALAGVFLPAVTGARASVFRGSIDITGTLDNPRLNGITTIQDGQLSLKSASAALGGGITHLSGTLRISGGNTLQIDPTDPLRGTLVPASEIDAPTTGNRAKSTFIKRPGGETTLEGAFELTGSVQLDMNELGLTTFRRDLAAHHYNLQLLVHDATLANGDFSGLRHMNLAMRWQTGESDPRHEQHLRWIASADGINAKGATQGTFLGFGNFVLDPAFGMDLGRLLAVQSRPFRNAEDFVALKFTNDKPLLANIAPGDLNGNLGSLTFHNYAIAVKDVGNGLLNGALELQNTAAGSLKVAGEVELSQSKLVALPAQSETTSFVSWPNTPQLDVRFDLGEAVNFTSSNLQATLDGFLRITGTPLDPLALGTFSIKRGQASFPGARARITEGEIGVTVRRDLLTGQLLTRTEIDATAEGRSGRYLITLHLHGPLDTGQATNQTLLVDISSTPPLSRDEAFAQLLGTSVINAHGLENRDQAYAQMVIGLLSGPLFSGLENTLAQTFGLSSITLDYQLNEPIGVEVGKAVGDRLYLSYRRSLGKNPGEPTPYEFRLEYRVRGNWQLGLKLNEKDQKTLTLEKKWRF